MTLFLRPTLRTVFCALLLTGAALPEARAQQQSIITRGPYLQLATTSSIHIVWRTRAPGVPEVRWGKSAKELTGSLKAEAITVRRTEAEGGTTAGAAPLFSAPAGTFQYEAKITGLDPDARYHYSILSDGAVISPADEAHTFRTLPGADTTRPLNFWVVGDSGTGHRMQLKVHTAMRDYLKAAGRTLDGYLHVGDMAYGAGLDSEFQGYFFESYQQTLQETVCWPAMGNHEGRTSKGNKGTGVGPYYDAYICPMAGEAGGVPSRTEAFYSFDIGGVHFICLNSHDLARDPEAAMAQWLRSDLEKAKADWIIAFFHHPPYTKGSHDSDKEEQLVEMRKFILPILETGGVDLVLTGHSHIYERSMLIDGAYDTPTTAAGHVLDDGDGRPSGDGAYQKPPGLNPNKGAVQIVTGNGGTSLARKDSPHPVMKVSIMEFGSVLLTVNKTRLIAGMLNVDGKVTDSFEINKEKPVELARIQTPKAPGDFIGPKKLPLGGKDPGSDEDKNKATVKVPANATPLIAKGSTWHYLAGAAPAAGWTGIGFQPDGWLQGAMGIGYDDGDDVTKVPGMRGKYLYLCIRREFELTGKEDLSKLGLAVSYDDGFIAYINGREVLRVNVDTGSLGTAKGVEPHEALRKYEYFSLSAAAPHLKPGRNVIAIEGHNDDLGSSDFTLDPYLILEKKD